MKKMISLIISLALIAAFAAFHAEAKILSECHCCGGDGIYTCDAVDCRNGKLPCGRCNGTGEAVEKCAECDGTGKCGLCHGTGKRLGDETIDCDNCKGTGQCQGGPGWGACTQGYYYSTCPDCKGEGTVWHNSEWCVYARNHNGQCPVCKGTGYEGDGAEGTPNDGVSNVPRPGDGIYYLNGSYAVYGGGSSGNGSKGTGTETGNGTGSGSYSENGANIARDPKTGRDFIWFVDLGAGTWEFNGNTVTVIRNGSAVSGTVDLKYSENIELSGLPDNAEIHAYLVGSDGSKIELELSGDHGIAVERHLPKNAAVPFNVRLTLECTEAHAADDPGTEQQEQPGSDTPQADVPPVPENRNTDFEIPMPTDTGRPVAAYVRVETGKMTDEEQRYYAGLPEDDLARVLTGVITIVASAEPGRSDSDTDKLLDSLAAKNGYETLPEGRLFPLYFEGHQEIGFPVRVTVSIEQGLLNGGTDLYVYHIADGGEIESLGKAEYGTYEDGSIETVSFYTSSFSVFFTSAKELDLSIKTDENGSHLTGANEGKSNGNTPVIPIAAGGVALAVIAALAIVTAVKKRKSNM